MPGLVYATFQEIDFSALLQRDIEAVASLRKACEEDGFFYLKLDGPKTVTLLQDWKDILVKIDEWFDLPIEEKMKHKHGTVKHGYCPIGSYTGVYKGSLDGNETIKVTADAMNDPMLCPDVINTNRGLFERFNDQSRQVTLDLLAVISDILQLRDADRTEKVHRTGEPSSSCLNLIRYVKEEETEGGIRYSGQNQHTDNGSLTFLLSEQPGLQVVSKDTGDWEPVLPKANHAIVNVADTLRFLSGLRFRSAVHRAIPVWSPGQRYRYVVGYFLRAEDSAVLKYAPNGPMTAKEWHDQKYVNYKLTHVEQKDNPILLGGMNVSKEGGKTGHLFDLPELPRDGAVV